MSNCSKKRAKLEAVTGGPREANAAVASAGTLATMHALVSRLQKKQKSLVSNVFSYFLLWLLSYLRSNTALDDFVVNSPVWLIRPWISYVIRLNKVLVGYYGVFL